LIAQALSVVERILPKIITALFRTKAYIISAYPRQKIQPTTLPPPAKLAVMARIGGNGEPIASVVLTVNLNKFMPTLTTRGKLFLAIFLAVILIAFVFMYINSEKGALKEESQEESVPGQFPISQPSSNFHLPDRNDEKMFIETKDGNVATNNLYKSPVENLDKNGVLFEENAGFHSSFYPQDQGFLITILDTNIEKGRRDAEENFLQDLGITKDEACKLKVDLGVPSFVNQDAAGKNYGLSFCPNGKPFPNK
jgi:hypothetical protein